MSNVDILKIHKKINSLDCCGLFCDIFLPNVDILHLTTFEVNGKRGLREKFFKGQGTVAPGAALERKNREGGSRMASVSRAKRRQAA